MNRLSFNFRKSLIVHIEDTFARRDIILELFSYQMNSLPVIGFREPTAQFPSLRGITYKIILLRAGEMAVLYIRCCSPLFLL